jgi:SAM-dependent methyltransferase
MFTAEADAPKLGGETVSGLAGSLAGASFRDPAGAVFRKNGRILRAVEPTFIPELESFLSTRAARKAIDSGRLVSTSRVSEQVFEHERIPFASYPYEWPAEMLHAAGELTLDLASAALEEGFGIKDATPYNVLFRGTHPVFVDLLSFERREERDASWMAYAQFVRTFLLPLAAYRYFGMHPADPAAHRDGLDPETVYQWLGWRRRLTPPLLGLVSLPRWLARSGQDNRALYHPKPVASAEQARFVLQGLLKSCWRQLGALAPRRGKQSAWTDYVEQKSLYSPQQLAQKEEFVREALAGARAVLDIGANEGHFSFLAARAGARVVALDSDPIVVGNIWRAAFHEQLDVLPLVVDLARPTPAMGWRNRECESFLDRARESRFDVVLMLAVLHHLLVSERIPLNEVLALASELTERDAVIEFVAPQDPMFQRIVRGREQLHADLTVERFEQAARRHFDVVRSQKIDGLNRWLYLLRRRS